MPIWLLPIWNFLNSKIGAYIAAGLAVILALWFYGHHEYERGYADAVAAMKKQGEKIGTIQDRIVHDIQTRYLPQQDRIVTVTKTIIKEVPKYVTLHDDRACTINRGFVRLHDAAADSAVPAGPAGDDGAPSGVAPSAVIATVAENYGTCHTFATRLAEWQEWYVRNKTLFESGGRVGR